MQAPTQNLLNGTWTNVHVVKEQPVPLICRWAWQPSVFPSAYLGEREKYTKGKARRLVYSPQRNLKRGADTPIQNATACWLPFPAKLHTHELHRPSGAGDGGRAGCSYGYGYRKVEATPIYFLLSTAPEVFELVNPRLNKTSVVAHRQVITLDLEPRHAILVVEVGNGMEAEGSSRARFSLLDERCRILETGVVRNPRSLASGTSSPSTGGLRALVCASSTLGGTTMQPGRGADLVGRASAKDREAELSQPTYVDAGDPPRIDRFGAKGPQTNKSAVGFAYSPGTCV